MYCKNCGKEIDNNAEICPLCGVRVKEAVKEIVVEDKPSHLAGVASCCFPSAGFYILCGKIKNLSHLRRFATG